MFPMCACCANKTTNQLKGAVPVKFSATFPFLFPLPSTRHTQYIHSTKSDKSHPHTHTHTHRERPPTQYTLLILKPRAKKRAKKKRKKSSRQRKERNNNNDNDNKNAAIKRAQVAPKTPTSLQVQVQVSNVNVAVAVAVDAGSAPSPQSHLLAANHTHGQSRCSQRRRCCVAAGIIDIDVVLLFFCARLTFSVDVAADVVAKRIFLLFFASCDFNCFFFFFFFFCSYLVAFFKSVVCRKSIKKRVSLTQLQLRTELPELPQSAQCRA